MGLIDFLKFFFFVGERESRRGGREGEKAFAPFLFTPPPLPLALRPLLQHACNFFWFSSAFFSIRLSILDPPLRPCPTSSYPLPLWGGGGVGGGVASCAPATAGLSWRGGHEGGEERAVDSFVFSFSRFFVSDRTLRKK